MSLGYRRGEFLRQGVSCTAKAESTTVELAPAEGSFVPWFTQVAFAIHGAPSKPREVTVDGTAVKTFAWNASKKIVTVTAAYARAGQRAGIAY